MLADYKRRTNIGVGIGLIGEILGHSLFDSGNLGLAMLVALFGAAFFIWGCAQYAQAKGHSAWLGVLGLLSLLGLIVLFFLPDRHKEARP